MKHSANRISEKSTMLNECTASCSMVFNYKFIRLSSDRMQEPSLGRWQKHLRNEVVRHLYTIVELIKNNKGSHLGRCEPFLFCYSFNQLISTKLQHKSMYIHHLRYQTILRQVYTKREPT